MSLSRLRIYILNGEIPSVIAEADVNCLTLPSGVRGNIGCGGLLRGDRRGVDHTQELDYPDFNSGNIQKRKKYTLLWMFFFFSIDSIATFLFENQLSFLPDIQKKRYKS